MRLAERLAFAALEGVLVVERAEAAQTLGHDDGVVAGLEAEVGRGVGDGQPAAHDGQQGRLVVLPEPRRELVGRQVDVVVGEGDAIELRPVAAGDDVGDEPASPG